jgi:excisionase family DNA binding protein
MEQLMTLVEAAEFLQVSESTLRRLIRKGKIRHYRIGGTRTGSIRFRRSELLEDMRVEPEESVKDTCGDE